MLVNNGIIQFNRNIVKIHFLPVVVCGYIYGKQKELLESKIKPERKPKTSVESSNNQKEITTFEPLQTSVESNQKNSIHTCGKREYSMSRNYKKNSGKKSPRKSPRKKGGAC